MPTISFRQKTPVDWVCRIDGSDLSPVAQSILEGFGDHIGQCLGQFMEAHEISPYDRLRLSGLLSEIGDRLRENLPVPEATKYPDKTGLKRA